MLYATTVMDAGKSPSNRRLTVKEAAKRLNASEAAIRQRIQRGSIDHEKDEETNRVFVLIDEDSGRLDEDETPYETGYERELIDTLREQLAAEREANRENRRIIAALASRIPEVDAPTEPRQPSVTASEEFPGTHDPQCQRRRYRTRNTSARSPGGGRSSGWSRERNLSMAEGVLQQWKGRRVRVVTLGDPGGVATGGQILGTLREVGTDGIMLETEINEGRIEFRPWHGIRLVVEE